MHSEEEWAAVPGYEGRYEVSTLGRVKSLARKGRRSDLILKPISQRYGHVNVKLCREGSVRHELVHRIVLNTFVGPCPPGMEACHGPGGSSDNRLSNLRWDTHSENMRDRVKDGSDRNANKTHCVRMHPYDEVNTYRAPDGSRGCRACGRVRDAARYRAKRKSGEKS